MRDQEQGASSGEDRAFVPPASSPSVSPVPASIPSAALTPEAPQSVGCGHCDGLYPMYGVAPHDCFWRKGPEFSIGQSTVLPVEQWTDAFVPELEDGETWADFAYPAACGIYYCPHCQSDRYRAAWDAFVAKFGPPPAQAIEARRAETGTGSVHESAVRQDAPNTHPGLVEVDPSDDQ